MHRYNRVRQRFIVIGYGTPQGAARCAAVHAIGIDLSIKGFQKDG